MPNNSDAAAVERSIRSVTVAEIRQVRYVDALLTQVFSTLQAKGRPTAPWHVRYGTKLFDLVTGCAAR